MRETDACVEMSLPSMGDLQPEGSGSYQQLTVFMLSVFLLSSASNQLISGIHNFVGLCKEDRFKVANCLPIWVLFKNDWICECLSPLLAGISVNGKVNNLGTNIERPSLAHLYNNQAISRGRKTFKYTIEKAYCLMAVGVNGDYVEN